MDELVDTAFAVVVAAAVAFSVAAFSVAASFAVVVDTGSVVDASQQPQPVLELVELLWKFAFEQPLEW